MNGEMDTERGERKHENTKKKDSNMPTARRVGGFLYSVPRLFTIFVDGILLAVVVTIQVGDTWNACRGVGMSEYLINNPNYDVGTNGDSVRLFMLFQK